MRERAEHAVASFEPADGAEVEAGVAGGEVRLER